MAADTAAEIGVDPRDELALYVVHGLLHLCGYDDLSEHGAAAMRRREDELLKSCGRPNPFDRAGRRGHSHGQPETAVPIGHRAALDRGVGVFNVVGMSLAGLLVTGLLVLGIHLFSIALTKALRSYSRSLLEELCAVAATPNEPTTSTTSTSRPSAAPRPSPCSPGSCWRASGAWASRGGARPAGLDLVIVIVLAIGLVGYVLAGVIGKVFAETIIDATWPASGVIRAVAWPLTFGFRQVERLVEWFAGSAESPPRPASVEVEISMPDEEDVEDEEPDLPEAVRHMLERTIELTRTDVVEIMTPRPMIVSLPSTATAEEAAAAFRQTGLSRIPLFGANHDDIVGILYVKDLFARITEVKDFAAVSPAQARPPGLLHPGDQERLRAARGDALAAAADRHRAR